MAKKGLTDLSYFKHIGTRPTNDEDGPFSLETSTKVSVSAWRPVIPATPLAPTFPLL
jgi:hypothetical protein